MIEPATGKRPATERSSDGSALPVAASIVPDYSHRAAATILAGLKDAIARELHEYPYPIAGCDEVFKTLTHQRECCRIALTGLDHRDGLTPDDAAEAIGDLLATPAQLTEHDRATLAQLARITA